MNPKDRASTSQSKMKSSDTRQVNVQLFSLFWWIFKMNVGKNKSISTFFFLPALDPFIISRRRRSLQHGRYTGEHTETRPASLFAFNRRDYHFHSNRHHHRLVQRASTHHHHETSKPFDFSSSYHQRFPSARSKRQPREYAWTIGKLSTMLEGLQVIRSSSFVA